MTVPAQNRATGFLCLFVLARFAAARERATQRRDELVKSFLGHGALI
jgi:hypothetical protein